MKLEVSNIDFDDLEAFMNDLVVGHDLRAFNLKGIGVRCHLLTVNKRYWLKTWKDTGCEPKNTNEWIESSFAEELHGQGHMNATVWVV